MVFIVFDFISLLLQAAGGGIASSADTVKLDNIGKNIMVAGVSWQVASLFLFAALCLDFALRVRNATEVDMNPAFATFRNSRKFKFFLCGLAAATLTIFIRSVFRCAELSGGFHGRLANQEVTFMILEGAMICIAVICLTVFHPGLVFGQNWHMAAWKIRGNSEPAEKIPYEGFLDAQAPPEGNIQEMRTISYSSTKDNARLVNVV
jgi:hypothetical protein